MNEILKKIPFFQQLTEDDIQAIIDNVQMNYFPEGHTIFKEGDEGDKMYIIKRGNVQVIRDQAILAELTDNAFFGEMALVSEEPRNADVVTTSETEVLTLDKYDFRKLLATNPNIAEMVSYEVVNRSQN